MSVKNSSNREHRRPGPQRLREMTPPEPSVYEICDEEALLPFLKGDVAIMLTPLRLEVLSRLYELLLLLS